MSDKKGWRENFCSAPFAGAASKSRTFMEDAGACGAGARQRAVDAALQASRPLQEQAMSEIKRTIAAASVADPDMCEVVKPPIKRIVDMLLGDVMVSVRTLQQDFHEDSIRSDVEGTVHARLATQGKDACVPLGSIRAWLLYHFLPFDLSIFGQLKDPIFLVMCVLTMINGYPRIAFGALILLCLLVGRAPDEFQIVNFILVFKGTTFVSNGLFTGVYAAVKYFWCVHPDGTHTCMVDGPAASVPLVSSIIDLVGSCVLVWIAYFALPYTVHHGYSKDIDDDDKEHAASTEHGGHLTPLFHYDVVCVFLTLILFCFLAYHDAEVVGKAKPVPIDLRKFNFTAHALLHDKDEVTSIFQTVNFHRPFFFGKLFYALLSAPFVVFKLPVLNTILTHTQPTGFNSKGQCVPFTLRAMPTESTTPE